MVNSIDQVKQLDYAQTREEYTHQIALEMDRKRTQQRNEVEQGVSSLKAEEMPKEGFNGA